jgi:hypothetical protein
VREILHGVFIAISKAPRTISKKRVIFLKASDAGGMSGTRISWMYIKGTYMRGLAAGVGLRPDTTLLSVELDSESATASIQQWTGSNFTERLQWGGAGSKMPTELSNPPNRNLAGQQLSVAVFHVTI